jgi:hypothetical protein
MPPKSVCEFHQTVSDDVIVTKQMVFEIRDNHLKHVQASLDKIVEKQDKITEDLEQSMTDRANIRGKLTIVLPLMYALFGLTVVAILERFLFK